MNWIAISAIMLAFGVGAGAFGAHGLKDRLGEYLSTYETGVLYHLIHALGMLLVSVLEKTGTFGSLNRINWLLFIGIILFSGSLYALAITKIRIFGAITPIGGVAFILAWILLAVKAFKV
ncbi:MAG: DUF423 domain-containing protein [Bdellovibrionota bacterium]